MRNLFDGKPYKFVAYSVGLFLLGFVFFNAVGYLFQAKDWSVFAAASEIDKYQVRTQLLMKATDEVGAASAEEAAMVWGHGLDMRSAALQYAVMTPGLKAEYAAQLETTYANWVTGGSSPWVDKYEIVSQTGIDKNWSSIRLRFHLITSTGPAGDYDAVLSIVKQGSHWQVAAVSADKELSWYTGFAQ